MTNPPIVDSASRSGEGLTGEFNVKQVIREAALGDTPYRPDLLVNWFRLQPRIVKRLIFSSVMRHVSITDWWGPATIAQRRTFLLFTAEDAA